MADAGAPIVSNRPKDDAFHQQRLKMWQPILSPMNVIIIFLVIGIAFIPSGIGLMNMSNDVYEDVKEYDSLQTETTCSVKDAQQVNGNSCEIQFTIEQDIDNDVYVYYELQNFYQNHRLYVKSQNVDQLLARDLKSVKDLETSCDPLVYAPDGKLLWPCGLIANSFFNDNFILSNLEHGKTMDETGIAWSSDFDKFKNPEGFKYYPTDSRGSVCSLYNLPSDCETWIDTKDSNKEYIYWYPDFNTRQYIFDKYDTISPIAGLQDEHFMVWMRTAALSKFRKIYGKVSGPFKKGDILKFTVVSKFEVRSFGGSKSIVISTLSPLGGKNQYVGTAFLVVGSVSILLTVLFIVKHLTSDRRKLGDTNLLRWED
jgi:hypothetical protein